MKETVQIAAVVGRQFELRLLTRVSSRPSQIASHLEALKRLDVIHEARFFPKLEYRFKHAVIQDVIYKSLAGAAPTGASRHRRAQHRGPLRGPARGARGPARASLRPQRPPGPRHQIRPARRRSRGPDLRQRGGCHVLRPGARPDACADGLPRAPAGRDRRHHQARERGHHAGSAREGPRQPRAGADARRGLGRRAAPGAGALLARAPRVCPRGLPGRDGLRRAEPGHRRPAG